MGAYRDGDLVGHCLGRPRIGETVALAGIAVEPSHQRRGLGTALLAALESRAASLGFQRVTLGSAGGYVDECYRTNGYSLRSILVRFDPDAPPEDYRDRGYEVTEERVEDGVRKLYVAADEVDPAVLDDVRETFDGPEAIYVMQKNLDEPASRSCPRIGETGCSTRFSTAVR